MDQVLQSLFFFFSKNFFVASAPFSQFELERRVLSLQREEIEDASLKVGAEDGSSLVGHL